MLLDQESCAPGSALEIKTIRLHRLFYYILGVLSVSLIAYQGAPIRFSSSSGLSVLLRRLPLGLLLLEDFDGAGFLDFFAALCRTASASACASSSFSSIVGMGCFAVTFHRMSTRFRLNSGGSSHAYLQRYSRFIVSDWA